MSFVIDPNWLISILYKVLQLSAGVFVVYLGYKLFTKGIYGDTGQMSVDWNDTRIVLKRAAPGSLFAIFGAIIIAVTINSSASYSPKTNHISQLHETELIDKKDKLVKLIKEGNPEWEIYLDDIFKDLRALSKSESSTSIIVDAEQVEFETLLKKAIEEGLESQVATSEDIENGNKS
ncbi:hypothetical protein [Vibrio parahaemolyticus]|uniref:hypothetical protein n=1 Tax=Vibrio parahaemolyticus TaxID=670 RepID=UPI00067CED67|nr:hypothetical protein [Vibrio parahaemolyticus]EGR1757708.1 hypothetical protein [Vibrio parahaemolyticus]ELA8201410.1 hypothetical protein [Vibrio parahaemolyticus]ELB2094451.1 hypothetical protein [Vibrio parahaemolyticus]ELB2126762.1 hypothetical protein [Vibrio parahaemolyticus]MBE4097520.1 hypothetical protein [Vibrio parahaemolyticus]